MAGAADDIVAYEPDDRCPLPLLLGVGLQGVMMILPSIVAVPLVTVRAADQEDSYLSWVVFASLLIAGAVTALQASRIGRFGAGHLLVMGPALSYAAISTLALEAGGPVLLASLTVAASLFYVMLAFWLPLLRRIITPVVSGTAMVLIAVSVLPIVLGRVQDVPEGASQAVGLIAALATLTTMTVLSLRAPRRLRLWSPLIALGVGCIVTGVLGAYEIEPVADAAWFGVPVNGLPGLDVTPGLDFLALLPVFVVVTLVGGIKNMGDNVAVQQVSWRRRRVTDFRRVQGSLNTNGLGILLSGLVGTPATSAYASRTVSLISQTLVATRRVGYVIGATFVVLALSPKLTAILVSIPSPVLGSYVLVAVGMLFVSGIRTLVKDGLYTQKAVVVATSFAVGAGLEHQPVFLDLVGARWSPLLHNGVVVGAVTAVLLTVFMEMSRPMRQARVDLNLGVASLPELDEFLRQVAARAGWNELSTQRLRSAGEETLISLAEPTDFESTSGNLDGPEDRELKRDAARLIVIVRPGKTVVEMEFLAVFDDENLEDRLAYLDEEEEGARGLEEREISLRLLRHYASSVHHQRYYGLDVVTVQIKV